MAGASMRKLVLASLLLLSGLAFGQLSNDTGAVATGGKLYKGVSAPVDNCRCNSNNPSAPCVGSSITQEFSPTTFQWQFSCSGGLCECGRFVTGDFWVKHPTGGAVVVSSVTPAGTANGLMIDPSRVFGNGTALIGGQGLLEGAPYYLASQNQMANLPISVTGRKTLVKAARCTKGVDCVHGYPTVCGGFGAKSYSMLTVVDAVPADGANGRNTFRPPFVVGPKPERRVSEFNLARLPQRQDILVSQAGLDAMVRWMYAYPDVLSGDQGRCFVPGTLPNDYAAGLAQQLQQDILSLLGDKTGLDYQPAVYSLLQRGLDIYSSWQYGNRWYGGAGQHLGRKPALVFLAALSTDPTVQFNVQQSSKRNVGGFQEDDQISVTPNSNGKVIWAAGFDGYYDETSQNVWPGSAARHYWASIFKSKCYDGANNGDPAGSCRDLDAKGAGGDPYGYIDGPAGLPGTQYMQCCSSGPHIAHATAMLAWKDYCEMANDQEPIAYADKMYYPSHLTAPGMDLANDPCAPPDPRESPLCDPYRGVNCLYFGGRTGATDGDSTWGPRPSNPAMCIFNNANGNTGQTGRFSWMHGKRFMSLKSDGTLGTLTYNLVPFYFASIAQNQYSSIRGQTPRCNNGVWTP